jgi:HTH-type transcriptional regulator / antitoxin HigA
MQGWKMKKKLNRDWASHPGETLRDIIEEKGISQNALAAELHVTAAYVSYFLNGRCGVSLRLAFALEQAKFSTAVFWMTRQVHYEVQTERLKRKRAKERQ